MTKKLDVCKNDCAGILPMLSLEELHDFDTFELSEMIKSIDYAIRYTKECSFTFSCFGKEETSEKVKAITNELKGYLERVKGVYRAKIIEEEKTASLLRDVNA